ncbi:DMT family transporter [Brevibacillus fluminis]|uniref:DMT family transporter n=1 Tax=Brevibacillus fluminis TaxID=511487 RepID=A0A3M8DQ60_9BACL|nr:DMT family transporter [Brevibacillus fluminis]RNB89659.1 DMT family transporter [Brevibacillus fluminis]
MNQKWKAIGLVIFGSIVYGFVSITIKMAYERGYSFSDVLGMQLLSGFMLLLVGTTLFRQWEKVNRKQLVQLLLAGTLNAMTGIFYQISLQHVPASIAIVLIFQFIWIGVLIECLIERKRPAPETIISVVLLLIGTAMASNVVKVGLSGLSLYGVAFGLSSAVTYSGVIAASGRIAVQVNPWMRSLTMNSSATLLVWVLFRPTPFTDGAFVGGLWYWGLIIACCSVLIPNLCFAAGTPKIGSALAGILGSVELPATVFLSWIMLQETVTPVQWVGNAIILGGIGATRLKLKKRKTVPFRVSDGQPL